MVLPTETAPMPIVFVHVHYPEIWAEMAPLLAARMDVPFRLVLTAGEDEVDELAVPETPLMQAMDVERTENRGRDVLPFLRRLAAEHECTLGLKLHTKRSPQRQDGREWLAALMDGLLPPGGAAPLVAALAADGRVGFVPPAGFALSVRPWVLENRAGMERVMALTGTELVEADLDDAFFAAGSMFWFRRAALLPLLTPPVLAGFEGEEGQLDGTAAHAAERLFPVIAKREGYASVAADALLRSAPSMGRAALLALARGAADIPSTYFPAPGVAELPPGTDMSTVVLPPQAAG